MYACILGYWFLCFFDGPPLMGLGACREPDPTPVGLWAFDASRAQVHSACILLSIYMFKYFFIDLLLSWASVPSENLTLRQLLSGLCMPAGIG